VKAAVCSEKVAHNLTTTGRHIPKEVISMATSIRTSTFVCAEYRVARENRRTLFTLIVIINKMHLMFTGNHNTLKLVYQHAKSKGAINCLKQQ
jgi:hypothetical protein